MSLMSFNLNRRGKIRITDCHIMLIRFEQYIIHTHKYQSSVYSISFFFRILYSTAHYTMWIRSLQNPLYCIFSYGHG